MSYHKFPNLRERLQADLGGKLNKNVGSLDFDTLPCNCNIRTKINDECPYNNLCRHSIVVYKATCRTTQKFYIGCTQQKLKARFNQHFNETVNAANKGLSSDTFAKHFAKQATNEGKTTVKHIRDNTSFEILWQGNPLSSSKSFGKLNCNLCMKERLEILKAMKQQPKRLIKSSADEGPKGQKRVNVSTNKILAKKGRGRPKKGTVFKKSTVCNNICTEVDFNNCTALEISPLSFNGKKFAF